MHLICAAVIEELSPLSEASDFRKESETLFVHRREPVLVAALGVGLVDFASRFQSLLHNYKIDEALLTGTCGAYPEALSTWPIGSLVSPEKISLADLSAVEKSGYLPAPIISPCSLDVELFSELLPNVGGHCLTLTTITSADPVASRIEEHYQAHFEQMEVYAFARLCQLNKVRGSALFAVANRVGRDSHVQWLAHAQAGAFSVANVIRERFNLC